MYIVRFMQASELQKAEIKVEVPNHPAKGMVSLTASDEVRTGKRQGDKHSQERRHESSGKNRLTFCTLRDGAFMLYGMYISKY